MLEKRIGEYQSAPITILATTARMMANILIFVNSNPITPFVFLFLVNYTMIFLLKQNVIKERAATCNSAAQVSTNLFPQAI